MSVNLAPSSLRDFYLAMYPESGPLSECCGAELTDDEAPEQLFECEVCGAEVDTLTPVTDPGDPTVGYMPEERFVCDECVERKSRQHSSGGGYVYTRGYGHQREHTRVAELALGHKLPKGAEIHHVNEIRWDNRPSNLVICENRRYHQLLHLRAEALKATGDPSKRRCVYCREWDDLENLYIRECALHRSCKAAYDLTRAQVRLERAKQRKHLMKETQA